MMISCGAGVDRFVPWLPVFGEQLANWNTPVGSLLKGGVMVTNESEGGGGGTTPFYANYLRMTRKTQWGDVIAPHEAIDRVSAIKMQTIWGAYYVLKEKELGSLEPGKFADFVVLNKDYFTVPDEEIPTVFSLMTVLGGKTLMLRTELAKELGLPAAGVQKEWKFQPEFNPEYDVQIRRDE